MRKPRIVARILACLEHAKADTAEGANARRIAVQLMQRHGITEMDLATASAWRREESQMRAPLKGWTEPWLVLLAANVTQLAGADILVKPGPEVLVIGPGAGRIARRLDVLRLRVEARVARVGGPAAIAALPVRRVLAPRFHDDDRLDSLAYALSGARPAQTLGGLFGRDALDVFRAAVALRYIEPERQAAERRAREQAAAEWAAEGRRDTPQGPAEDVVDTFVPEDAAGSGPRHRTAPPPPPPPADEGPRPDPDAVRALVELQRGVERLVAQLQNVGRPSWVGDDEPEAGAMVSTW